VLLADDHAPLRRGVRLALEQGGFRVVADVSDADAAVEAAVRLNPDICLLDINMPGNGIRAASLIHERAPSSLVVMLTISNDPDHLFAALKAGADGYLLKETDPRRLPAALTGVLAGEAALPRTLVTRLIEEFRKRDERAARIRLFEEETQVTLTAREWDVLEQLGAGHSTAEIAELLGIAPVTVRTHVAAVLRKLHLRDRDAVVRRLRFPGGGDPPVLQ
jgi:DNA-binding NarL/FixJ family response regulator